MFSWKIKRNLDPYFRVVYALQFVAVLTTVVGLFLVWWDGGDSGALTAFDLLSRSTDELQERQLTVLAHPLTVLWLLWPSLVLSGLRSFTGILVAPVWYRRLALAAWVAAALAVAHFYINFGDELAANSPLKDGTIQAGFWVTGSATAFLGLLILVEGAIRPQDDPWMVQEPVNGSPVEDAERLWRGEYLTCPHCGMLNEPGARSCYNCHNLLFNF